MSRSCTSTFIKNPELAFHEAKTSAMLAARVRALGYEVTTGVGSTGIATLLKNGPGPTVMLRTELDALPVEEKTGLPFASKVIVRNDAGGTDSCGARLRARSAYVRLGRYCAVK
jgi:hippurate hydrolase